MPIVCACVLGFGGWWRWGGGGCNSIVLFLLGKRCHDGQRREGTGPVKVSGARREEREASVRRAEGRSSRNKVMRSGERWEKCVSGIMIMPYRVQEK